MELSPSFSQLALTFSADEDIQRAFGKLSVGVKRIIRNSNFNVMQEACMEEAKSPKNVFSENVVSTIEQVNKTFDDLFLTLTKSNHWNFLDTRMMEAMVTASMIPAAQQSLENFKKAFFGMKLDKVIPHCAPVIPMKPNHTILNEVLDKDPRQLTIAELHQHHFYLETEVLEVGRGTLSYYKIMVGSVIIEWQIHVDYANKVRLLLNKKKPTLSLQGISQLLVPDAIRWEGLPVIWIGQEVGEVGPIEPLTDEVKMEPYPLPKGFEWVCIHREIDELHESVAIHRLHWYSLHPKIKVLAIKSSTTTMFSWGVLICVKIRGKPFTLVQLTPLGPLRILGDDQTLFNKLYNLAVKELMRQFQFNRIYQAVIIQDMPTEIVKPLATFRIWHFKLYEDPLLYSTPQTAGLRKMTLKDVPNALALTNKYTSQFEIGQVFQSEEDFIHWFLPPSKDVNVVTYVVEDSITGNITDMFSFTIPVANKTPPLTGKVVAIVNTKTPSFGLIVDLLLCAKQKGLSEILTYQFGLLGGLFERIFINEMTISMPRYYWSSLYLYNYSYPEVDQNNFVLFTCTTRLRMCNV